MASPNRRRFWGSGILTTVLLLGAVTGTALVREAGAQGTPTIEVVSPQPGETVTTDDIPVAVEVSNSEVDCTQSGRPDEQGVGHIHVMIDGMSMAQLANLYCQDFFVIPGDGLEPGTHTLIATLATNSHVDLMETAQEVEFDFQPAITVPAPEPNDQGAPGLTLVSPEDGATVPPRFFVTVEPVNFFPDEELEGKPNIPGFGHWHVFVDTTDPMALMDEAMAEMEEEMAGMTPAAGEEAHMAMPMPAMISMPGTNTFAVDLTAWGPGEHTIFIEPAQNDHTHFAEFEHLQFTVNVEPAA